MQTIDPTVDFLLLCFSVALTRLEDTQNTHQASTKMAEESIQTETNIFDDNETGSAVRRDLSNKLDNVVESSSTVDDVSLSTLASPTRFVSTPTRRRIRRRRLLWAIALVLVVGLVLVLSISLSTLRKPASVSDYTNGCSFCDNSTSPPAPISSTVSGGFLRSPKPATQGNAVKPRPTSVPVIEASPPSSSVLAPSTPSTNHEVSSSPHVSIPLESLVPNDWPVIEAPRSEGPQYTNLTYLSSQPTAAPVKDSTTHSPTVTATVSCENHETILQACYNASGMIVSSCEECLADRIPTVLTTCSSVQKVLCDAFTMCPCSACQGPMMTFASCLVQAQHGCRVSCQ